ncbi:aminoglycoside phosphotransferase family protein [Streptomyces somaliensis]|uniref:aminoglycoside phosphotransferase family protein n=1 Tax=Streptomyces somaliensis TaxID=78355 RepID=UPI0020CD025A|nr:aminoglycoside phosphotransferase family protein [Streptomyces somaliensis]MCP9944406.1 aminoglycoside phosphotransferase family protein [Streptomyces somaliensis]MCP9962360.1 aminoglycoside phosphotransferase family protein [Streptomyces somaliensis]MCP9975179.1 aminoglycoside phosphotransferase family protein [Streptomyces somaliensis]
MVRAADAPVPEPPRRLVRALRESGGGAAAGAWLDGFPETARRALSGRGMTAERVVEPGGRSSVVLLVRRARGERAALKLAPPSAAPDREREALAHWDGRGAVRLLDDAGDGPGLPLERLRPDVSLRSLPDAKALLEAAGAVRRLWVAPPEGHRFESVADRTARMAGAMAAHRADGAAGPLVAAALEARRGLLADAPEALLLHGCFRQGKVLAGERYPWLVVGPEPVVGERAYDLARLVRDRVEDLVAQASGAAAARRRLEGLADGLDVDRERLRGWTLFRAVEAGVRALGAGRVREAEPLLEFAGWL